jgi:hypothetical protein
MSPKLEVALIKSKQLLLLSPSSCTIVEAAAPRGEIFILQDCDGNSVSDTTCPTQNCILYSDPRQH